MLAVLEKALGLITNTCHGCRGPGESAHVLLCAGPSWQKPTDGRERQSKILSKGQVEAELNMRPASEG